MLGRLGLHLVCCSDIGHECHVYETDIVGRSFAHELTCGFDEGKRFDIADLRDDDISIRLIGNAVEAFLDRFSHVRNDLHGTTEKIAAALSRDERLIDRSLSEVGFLSEAFIDEAFIMSQIEIGFLTVVGNEDFAVLERRHGARIDV